MPRYFFNIYDGQELFDDAGTELSGMGEMRLYMLTMARVWIEREENQQSHWSIEARDEDENIVGSVKFGVQPEEGNG